MAKQADGKCDGVYAGEMKPQQGDNKLGPADTADSVMMRVAAACDDDTGVFFFRHKSTLYWREVSKRE